MKLTPTLVLFQPFAFAAGVRVPMTVGFVLSRRYEALPASELPSHVVVLNAVTVTFFVPSPLPAVRLKVHTEALAALVCVAL